MKTVSGPEMILIVRTVRMSSFKISDSGDTQTYNISEESGISAVS